jgi:hypothetical protein
MKKRLAIFSALTVIIVSVFFLFPVQIFAQPSDMPMGDPGEGFVHLSVNPGAAGEDTEFTLRFDEPLIKADSITLDYYFALLKFSGTWDELMNKTDPEDYIVYDKMGTAHPPDKIEISRDLSEGHYFGFLISLPFTADNVTNKLALQDGNEFSNWDKVKFSIEEEKEEGFIRTMPMTCYQVWVNSDNKFEMVFWYPYRDNNWVKIYDMSGKEVYSVDMPLDDPHIIVDLPNGMYTVKTFNDDPSTPIQTFIIGK